jgi:hypothetical protein
VMGEEENESSVIEVEADDGTSTFEARVTGRRFLVKLPPRVYSLTARAGDGRVGRVEAVEALPGVEREVAIRLEDAATIEGTVRGIEREQLARVSLRALRAGTDHQEAAAEPDEDGAFTLAGLVPGGRYDLVVRARFAPERRIAGVVAPATGVDVQMDPWPLLRGALGAPAGGTCGGEKVSVRDQEGIERLLDLGADCRFQTRVPPGAEVLVRVSGDGRHHEAQVTVPADGEPEPLCFDPPCIEPVLATLEVRLGEPDCPGVRGLTASTEDGQSWDCAFEKGRCQLERLRTGRPLTLNLQCGHCGGGAEERVLVMQPGANAITLPCPRMRAIEGIVRRLGGSRMPVPLTVRCPGGMYRVRDSFLFRLRCSGDVQEIEYLLDSDPGHLHKLPVAGNESPVLVELPLP